MWLSICAAAAIAAEPAEGVTSAQLWLEQRGERWSVYADDAPLDGPGLASALGDRETLDRIEEDRIRSRRQALILAGVGVGLLAAAPLPGLLATSPTADDIDPGVLDPGETRLDEMEHQEWIAAQDGTWAGVFLGLSGALVIVAAPAVARSHRDRRADPSAWYDPAEVFEKIEDLAAGEPEP